MGFQDVGGGAKLKELKPFVPDFSSRDSWPELRFPRESSKSRVLQSSAMSEDAERKRGKAQP